MKYAVQVHRNESTWCPGLFPFKTKREAVMHRNNVNKTGGTAYLVRKDGKSPFWTAID